ncbi:MAG: alpha/beta fold hydrolase [Actinomycetales bacterium]|nr:alpha/beta fold hydrolase [Actinomycetales bacterium]
MSLALFLISGLGSALVQTSGGAVTMKTLTWETPAGLTQSAYLFKPAAASADDKRPAVVVAHGYNNQKQMQDNNYVELAKRGYVVLSIDRYSHGSSDNTNAAGVLTLSPNAAGVYDGVTLLASLPYVDASRIGVSGHSMGCMSASAAVGIDSAAPTPLIAAAYLVDCDPTVTDQDGKFIDFYGARDVAVYADKYDEFFFRADDGNGGTTVPRDYIDSVEAQAFLHFGTDPSGADQREAYTTYTETVDGSEVIRRIDTPNQIHPWATFSATEAHDLVSFFDEAFGSPNAIDPASQTWQLKAFFNGLGLVGLGIFLVAFARALLAAPIFASLRTPTPAAVELRGGRSGRGWFWGAMAVSVVISAVSFVLLSQSAWSTSFVFVGTPGINPQGPTSFIGIWAAINGIVALLVMLVSYYAFGKRNGQDLRQVGIFPGWKKFGLGILLGLIVVVAVVAILFAEQYFFQSDFRLYVLAITTFTPDKIALILLYLPLYLVFYVLNSVAINSFNRFTVRGREWGNTLLLAVLNALPAVIVIAVQYLTFAISGELAWHDGQSRITGIWMQFVLPYLFVTVFVTRKIFRATNNPYIGGFIMASIATIASVSTTITVSP